MILSWTFYNSMFSKCSYSKKNVYNFVVKINFFAFLYTISKKFAIIFKNINRKIFNI